MRVIHLSTGQSPLMGCLFTLGILLITALLIVGAGVAAVVVPVGFLIWRLVRFFLPAPVSGEVPEQSNSSSPSPGVIDVEATVIPPALKDERVNEETR